MQSFRRIVASQLKELGGRTLAKRLCSNAIVSESELMSKGSVIFLEEQKRQLEEIGRIEKVPVHVSGPIEDVILMMNEGISTPYDCCRHISLPLCHQSPLALINDSILWDMHRPLPGECNLRFLSFRDPEPFSVNEAFWRTGSLILGAVLKIAFKEEAGLTLWSFPEVKLSSGSFIYDAVLNFDKWRPTTDELKVLSGEFLSFVHKNHKIERLDVKKSVALEIFSGDPNKQQDVKRTAALAEDNLVTLYKVGDHIDVCNGPMIGNTSFFGRCSVTSVHPLHEYMGFPLYRFQGIALPKGILLNSFAYGIIFQRAQNLNEIPVGKLDEEYQPYGVEGVCPRNSDSKVSTQPLTIDDPRI